VLVTISTTQDPATDLGFLLHKHPEKVQAKRSLAARLVAGEPLWRVHECVFAVLAMESEPVDPRL
jgi:PNKP adenylyltransferase domain, C-terminal region/RNA repair, ligase-Pnkp-associating, region of Hen1